jgi:hypothetical protein
MSARELATEALPNSTVASATNDQRNPLSSRFDRLSLAFLTLSMITIVVRRTAHSVWNHRQQTADEKDLERFVAYNCHVADDIGLTAERRLPHSFSQ